MIELYSWPTPNGHKLHIMLEEVGLDYKVHPINIGKGEQFDESFLKSLIIIPIIGQMLHFYLDSQLWKFSEPHNRKTVLKYIKTS